MREIDDDVILIFITNLAQYAIDGYTVIDILKEMFTKYYLLEMIVRKLMKMVIP